MYLQAGAGLFSLGRAAVAAVAAVAPVSAVLVHYFISCSEFILLFHKANHSSFLFAKLLTVLFLYIYAYS